LAITARVDACWR